MIVIGKSMRRGKKTGDLISATEIACFVYCPEQWRLQYGLGLAPGNEKQLAAGTRHHRRKAVGEHVAGWLIVVGQFVLSVALLTLLLWLVVLR